MNEVFIRDSIWRNVFSGEEVKFLEELPEEEEVLYCCLQNYRRKRIDAEDFLDMFHLVSKPSFRLPSKIPARLVATLVAGTCKAA